jgi:hypothetical protein
VRNGGSWIGEAGLKRRGADCSWLYEYQTWMDVFCARRIRNMGTGVAK